MGSSTPSTVTTGTTPLTTQASTALRNQIHEQLPQHHLVARHRGVVAR